MDLNVMIREQARAGLQTRLDAAVTSGDTAEATKVADEIAKLAVVAAPAAPPYGQADIRAELEKAPWFGTDPKRTSKAIEFGKDMNLKKFATAAAFAEALIKAVDEEFKPTAAAPGAGDDADGETGDDADGEAGAADPPERKPAQRRTDGPGEGDNNQRGNTRRASGPWLKLSDAPADVQKEVNRTADKMAPKTKEGRDSFVKRSLEAHYAAHQRKGKK